MGSKHERTLNFWPHDHGCRWCCCNLYRNPMANAAILLLVITIIGIIIIILKPIFLAIHLVQGYDLLAPTCWCTISPPHLQVCVRDQPNSLITSIIDFGATRFWTRRRTWIRHETHLQVFIKVAFALAIVALPVIAAVILAFGIAISIIFFVSTFYIAYAAVGGKAANPITIAKSQFIRPGTALKIFLQNVSELHRGWPP